MSGGGVNEGRRRFLTVATSVVGAAGAVGAAVPFCCIMESEREGKSRRCTG